MSHAFVVRTFCPKVLPLSAGVELARTKLGAGWTCSLGVVWEKVGRIAGCFSFSTVARDSNIAPAAGTGAWIIPKEGCIQARTKLLQLEHSFP